MVARVRSTKQYYCSLLLYAHDGSIRCSSLMSLHNIESFMKKMFIVRILREANLGDPDTYLFEVHSIIVAR